MEEQITEKKEVQKTIFPVKKEKVSEEEIFSVLKMVSPGTNLRAALDGIVKTGKGALIVIYNELLDSVVDGGFRVNCRFTPQKLIELSKMDGAIILSKDVKRINLANALLTPRTDIKTFETGTRHKAAERTARQILGLVIAISEKRHEINLFYKDIKYNIKHTEEILRKANEYIQLLEKQRELFDYNLEKLNRLELKNYFNLDQAVITIQKGRLIQKISQDLRKPLVELGNESVLLKARLKELLFGVEKEMFLIVKDYTKLNFKKSKILLESLSYDELLDASNILSALACEKTSVGLVNGWRIMSKTSLSEVEIALLTKQFLNLAGIFNAKTEDFSPILGEKKSREFKEEIDKIRKK